MPFRLAWLNCLWLILPLLCFLGIALIGRSWQYGALAAVFTLLHTWQGIQNL